MVLLQVIKRQYLRFRFTLGRDVNAAKLRNRGLLVHPTAVVEIPEQAIVLGSCTIGAYSIVMCRNQDCSPFQDSKLIIGYTVTIGEHCNIRAAGGQIIIGNKVMIASHVTMAASNHGMELGKPMMEQEWQDHPRDIVIGNDVWIAAGASILPGSRIGDGCVIAAGAVVRGEIPAYSIAAGVPARVISTRKHLKQS